MIYVVKYGKPNEATGAVEVIQASRGEAENALEAAQKAAAFIGPEERIVLVRPLWKLDW